MVESIDFHFLIEVSLMNHFDEVKINIRTRKITCY